MDKKIYTYTLIYIVAMVLVPFSGIPFDFRRFIVLIGSVVFLAYFWYMHRKSQKRAPEVVIEETIFESAPVYESNVEPFDQNSNMSA